MNKESKVIAELVSKIQDIVSFLKKNNLDIELINNLVSSMYKDPNNVAEKVEEKKELSINEARKIAEEDGKGYSYFGKWYTNKKTLQKELHLYGKEIDAFIKRMMDNGATLKEAIEDYVGRLVFGDIEEEIYGNKVKISDFCILNDIPMGIIRARKLERKSSYKDEIIKYIRSNDITPRYDIDKRVVKEPEKEKISNIEVDKPSIFYNGESFDSVNKFLDTYKFMGSNGNEVSRISKEKNISIIKAADIWLEEKFDKCKDAIVCGVTYESLSALLKFYEIPFCLFWLFCRDNGYKGKNGQREAILAYEEKYPEKFKKKESVQDRLKKPCTYNGEDFINGVELFRKYGIAISFGISTMQERGLSPEEVVDFHLQGDEFIVPKNNRTDPTYEAKGQQKLLEQSYTKTRKTKCKKVTYHDTSYSSVAEGLDDLGMTSEEGPIRYRMTKKNMSFEEAVDDVLVNKKNTGRKKKEEDFTYANVNYKTLNDACKCYNIRESKVRSYSYSYGINLETAFGILVGDITEAQCGIKKKRMYQENVWV